MTGSDTQAIEPSRALCAGVLVVAALLPLAALFANPTAYPLFYPKGDLGQTFWNHWWFDQALRRGVNPYTTDMLFAPFGAKLYLHTFEMLDAILATPVRRLAGMEVAWKSALFGHALWTGAAAFLLGRRLGLDRLAALIAALLAMQCGYRHINAQAISLQATGHLLFLAWSLVACAQEPPRIRYGAAAGAAVSMLLLSNWYYLAQGGLVLGVVAVALAVRLRPARASWLGWLRQGALALAIASPLLLIFAAGVRESLGHLGTTSSFAEWVVVRGSADLGQFLAPSWLRCLVTGQERVPQAYLDLLAPMRSISFAPPLCVLALAVWGWRRGARPRLGRAVSLGLAVAMACALFLALGPRVKLATLEDPADAARRLDFTGPVPVEWRGISVPSPYGLLSGLPVFEQMRVPMRAGYLFQVGALLWLAPLAAAGMRLGTEHLGMRGARAGAAGAALLAVALWEQGITFYPNEGRFPREGLLRVAEAPGPGGVHEAPAFGYWVNGMAMYHQTIHGRPILQGYLSRTPEGYDRWLETRLWYRITAGEFGTRARRLDAEQLARFRAEASADGLRFLALNPDSMDPERLQALSTTLTGNGLARLFHQELGMTILELLPEPPPAP
ncbi:MAG: hypothetical protein SF028_08970 [Candidatus Sumerlaeia bacterium]|nr:hypothetical protein [Candidatus Sumerlaeia bacterium]